LSLIENSTAPTAAAPAIGSNVPLIVWRRNGERDGHSLTCGLSPRSRIECQISTHHREDLKEET
jgi:hypothetical protein